MIKPIPALLYEQSESGRRAAVMPDCDVPESTFPEELLRADLKLPELSEPGVVRYFTQLSQLNFSIDTNFYPLGSCTMKYNPKVNEAMASLPGFLGHHPLQEEMLSQGSLELMYRLQEQLAAVSGFHSVSLQPAAGAQGEFAGISMIRAYHESRGEAHRRRVLIPDSAHGTNPATVTMAGYEPVELPSDANGNVDLQALKEACDDNLAALMITNPNTLGLFEEHIEAVTGTIHEFGGLVYGDGANMNALLGTLRPGDVGIDVMHFNLHKTFSTPHGGGGPGSGPVAAAEILAPFLPGPVVEREAEGGPYSFVTPAQSIGSIKLFYGNFGMNIRAFTYILMHGASGMRELGENAVLNANYLKSRIEKLLPVKYKRNCMHEFVAGGKIEGAEEITTRDIAKRLLDYGMHAPTVYFPLIVKEALMIEPTESENKRTLDAFVEALETIISEAREHPGLLHGAPHEMPLKRLDEVKAVKDLVLCMRP